MDQALFPGNYYDYADDELAIQREVEFGESIPGGYYIDDIFPPNARSLYFDPLNPPKGSLPNECIKWFRICDKEILGCENPILFKEDFSIGQIQQGALGDKYLLNAMSLLSCNLKYLKRLIVSTKYSEKGLYTLKFYKAGKWRYVHIDDYIPCRQSGKVHFARNKNINETYAMLIEKAYAKLHGCYEALTYGLIEKVIQDITPASGIECLRLERMNKKVICDELWERLEKTLAKGSLIGCGRFAPDPFAENPILRQGIALGELYQIIDLQIVSADPTEDFDALTVGMICVRNLQNDIGRFTGRWSYGNYLWNDYKQIATELADRTKQIQKDRGITEQKRQTVNYSQTVNRINYDDDLIQGDEPDTIDVRYIEKGLGGKMVQPVAEDLFWIQIEDFVEIFNRVYIVTDISFEKRGTCRRFVSKWLPGDFIAGAAGPPVVVVKESVEEDEDEEEEVGEDGEEKKNPSKIQKFEKTAMINDFFTDNPMYPFSVTEPTTMIITLYQPDKRWNAVGRYGQDPTKVVSESFFSRKQRYEALMTYPLGIGFILGRLSGLKFRLTEFRLKKIAYTSEAIHFSNTVSAVLRLFPGRYAIIPFTHTNLDRSQDYVLHCQYMNNHIEFEIDDVIQQRLQDREPSDDGLEEDDDNEPDDNDLLVVHNDPVNDANIEMKMEEMERLNSPEELLYVNLPKKVKVEKKLVPSRSREDEKSQLDDGEDAQQIVTDNVSILSYEKMKKSSQFDGDEGSKVGGVDDATLGSASAEQQRPMVPLPRLFFCSSWEYQEDMEELSMKHLYIEASEMMKYMRSLKTEVRKLYTQMKQTSTTTNVGNTSPRTKEKK